MDILENYFLANQKHANRLRDQRVYAYESHMENSTSSTAAAQQERVP